MRYSCVVIAIGFVAADVNAAAPDARALADRIDRHLDAKLTAAKVTPAASADDAEFFRRLSLDLTGRISYARDVQDFVAETGSAKRQAAIERMLKSHRYATHFANVWRALLLPEAAAGGEARYLQPGIEAWLKQR